MGLPAKELLGLLVLISVLHTSYAPFPKGHPYSFLNPLIEPWWNKISKDSQRQVLSAWKTVEPTAFALSRLVETRVDLLAGRRRDGPPKPYPTEYYSSQEQATDAEALAEEEGSPEAEAPQPEEPSPEVESTAEAAAPESQSSPSSFAY